MGEGLAQLSIDSGSLTSGVSASDFRLPRGTAMRYERPAGPLVEFFSTYVAMDADMDEYGGASNWMLPTWAQLWLPVSSPPITVSIGRRQYQPASPGNVYGVTSHAMPVKTRGGLTVVADITPLGWARFLPAAAEGLRDQVLPLDRVLPGWGEEIAARMHDLDRGRRIKPILDAFLLDRLPPPRPDEPLVRRIMALLVDPGTRDLTVAAADLGISYQALLRLTKRYFGFGPKLLMRRTRFIRAIAPMLAEERMPEPAEVPPGYHDASHFIRDANHFLGTTPRRFLAMEMPYLRAALRARALVADAFTPSLDPPARVALGTAA